MPLTIPWATTVDTNPSSDSFENMTDALPVTEQISTKTAVIFRTVNWSWDIWIWTTTLPSTSFHGGRHAIYSYPADRHPIPHSGISHSFQSPANETDSAQHVRHFGSRKKIHASELMTRDQAIEPTSPSTETSLQALQTNSGITFNHLMTVADSSTQSIQLPPPQSSTYHISTLT